MTDHLPFSIRFHKAGLMLLAAAAVLPASAAAQQSTQVPPSAYTISGWRVECGSQNNALACQALDQITARANNSIIAAISVTQPKNAKTPMISVQVPLGVALDGGVHVGFASGAQQVIPFVACYANGCFAQANISDQLLAQMRSAAQPLSMLYATYDANLNKQEIRISLPLNGFAVAYDKLK